jgi:hypothetical protein
MEACSETRPRKSINLESQVNLEGINAEFKSLRMRIKKLEQIVLALGSDMGNISDKPNIDKKG